MTAFGIVVKLANRVDIERRRCALEWVGLTRLVFACVALVWACSGARVNVLVPDGSSAFAVMNFTEALTLDPLEEGWEHRTFLRHPPMDISFVEKAGLPAIRLETHDSASILFRHVEIPLDEYPFLSWSWYVEQGIESERDEMTTAGDDHPARLFLDFESEDGDRHSMEIIWGNTALSAGDWKHLTFFRVFSFPRAT